MRFTYNGHPMTLDGKAIRAGDTVELTEARARQLAAAGFEFSNPDGSTAGAPKPHPDDIPEIQPVTVAKTVPKQEKSTAP